jgi:hypothetical protein
MLLERLAANRDAVLDDLGGFAQGQRVSLDRVRSESELDVVIFLQRAQGSRRHGPALIELGLLREDRCQ